MLGLMVLLAVGVVAGTVRVPLVALGPGPTFDVLGDVGGKTVVTINGRPTYPTTGRLNMTTVAVTDGLTAMNALRFWADGDRELVPRAVLYPPGKSDQQVEQENNQLFTNSESDAEVAALTYLNEPVKVLVGQLAPNAPAAGVLKPGDQMVTVKDQQITSPGQVSQILTTTKPGDRIPVSYLRGDGPVRSGTVTVGSHPSGPQGFLGVVMRGEPEDPNQIGISLGQVGGPSAGLAFALAVVDKLTPGDLLRGRAIAGTGEISPTGMVSPIGGIGLKMIAAKRDGATVFLVPAPNCPEAKSAAPDGLELVKVASLADAVSSLNTLNEGRVPAGC